MLVTEVEMMFKFTLFHSTLNICLTYAGADGVWNIVLVISEIMKLREWLPPRRSSSHRRERQLYKLNIRYVFKQLTLIYTPITIFIVHMYYTINQSICLFIREYFYSYRNIAI